MTGFTSKRKVTLDKLDDDDAQGYIAQFEEALQKEYQRGYDAGKASQPEQEPTNIAKLVEGMEVSIDVSTGDHDASHRLFGTVTSVQQNQGSKHGLILLVQDPEPNFKLPLPAQSAQEPVAWMNNKDFEPIRVRIMQEAYELADRNDSESYNAIKVMCGDVQRMLPPKREWMGLTDEEYQQIQRDYFKDDQWRGIEAKLKEKNS